MLKLRGMGNASRSGPEEMGLLSFHWKLQIYFLVVSGGPYML